MNPVTQDRNATAGSGGTPDAAPRATACDGGVSGATSSLAAAEAGSGAAPSNVQSPTGYCAGPLRPNRNLNDKVFEEVEVAEDVLSLLHPCLLRCRARWLHPLTSAFSVIAPFDLPGLIPLKYLNRGSITARRQEWMDARLVCRKGEAPRRPAHATCCAAPAAAPLRFRVIVRNRPSCSPIAHPASHCGG